MSEDQQHTAGGESLSNQDDQQRGVMDRIWAPWRMAYIQEEMQEEGCFLCNAWREDNDRENLLLWRTEHSLCLMNRYPYNNGHLLVAPAQHTGELLDLDDEQLLDSTKLLARCKRNLAEVMEPDGFNIGLNLGGAAGAGVTDHLHWHIVPRWVGDTNFMPVFASVKVIPQSLEALWETLREVDEG
jgi:ATP adenylyltransferase